MELHFDGYKRAPGLPAAGYPAPCSKQNSLETHFCNQSLFFCITGNGAAFDGKWILPDGRCDHEHAGLLPGIPGLQEDKNIGEKNRLMRTNLWKSKLAIAFISCYDVEDKTAFS